MFKKTITIKNHLTKTAFLEILKSKTDLWYSDASKNSFEGKINSDGTFLIFPTFDYNARNQLRPKISGEVFENNVVITFQVPKSIFYLIMLSIVVSFTASILSFIKDFEIKWYFFLIAPAIFCLIAYKIYSDKVKKSLKIIENLVK